MSENPYLGFCIGFGEREREACVIECLDYIGDGELYRDVSILIVVRRLDVIVA
jgi:hypothetical protein